MFHFPTEKVAGAPYSPAAACAYLRNEVMTRALSHAGHESYTTSPQLHVARPQSAKLLPFSQPSRFTLWRRAHARPSRVNEAAKQQYLLLIHQFKTVKYSFSEDSTAYVKIHRI